MNVLVADDDPTTRVLLRQLDLRDLDCEVTEVENGLKALTRLDEQRFTMLLLDVHMPIMGGLEALEATATAAARTGMGRRCRGRAASGLLR